MQLPKIVQQLADCIGLEAALRIVQKWGGRRLWVPAKPNEILIQTLGEEAAHMLCKEFAGLYSTIPRCAELLRAQRDADIRKRHADGESAAELAAAYRLNERHVYSILAQQPQPLPENVAGRPRKQLSLF